MSEKLSEAARLFLNDFDILNEARREVIQLFEAVWAGAKERFGGIVGPSAELLGRRLNSWEGYTDGRRARWYLNFGSLAQAVVHDPDSPTSRFREPKQFVVGIEATSSWKKEMLSNGGRGKRKIEQLAKEHDYSLNWDNLPWFVEGAAIEVNVDDPAETGRLVAEALVEMLTFVNKMVPGKEEEPAASDGATVTADEETAEPSDR